MSNSVINAISRAREKRNKKLAQWWQNQFKDEKRANLIRENRFNFDSKFSAGTPLELIPLKSPLPALPAENE